MVYYIFCYVICMNCFKASYAHFTVFVKIFPAVESVKLLPLRGMCSYKVKSLSEKKYCLKIHYVLNIVNAEEF